MIAFKRERYRFGISQYGRDGVQGYNIEQFIYTFIFIGYRTRVVR